MSAFDYLLKEMLFYDNQDPFTFNEDYIRSLSPEQKTFHAWQLFKYRDELEDEYLSHDELVCKASMLITLRALYYDSSFDGSFDEALTLLKKEISV